LSEGLQKVLSNPFGTVHSGVKPPFALSTPLIPQENFLFWVRLWVRRCGDRGKNKQHPTQNLCRKTKNKNLSASTPEVMRYDKENAACRRVICTSVYKEQDEIFFAFCLDLDVSTSNQIRFNPF